MWASSAFAALCVFVSSVSAETKWNNVVLTNDDGWAVAQIRAQYTALTSAGFDVILSAPAENQSGTGSSSETPTPLTEACEFNSCPSGSPAEGFNATNPKLNYVNGHPVDAVNYGINTLAPKFFNGAKPDFVISGPNVGTNLGLLDDQFSGTIGAASAATLAGIPAVAFSGDSTTEVSYTILDSDPTSQASVAAGIYADLTIKFMETLLNNSTTSILPPGVSINVNYPATDSCVNASSFKFVLSRIVWDPLATDVETCGSTHLPTETSVIDTAGCYSSVSVFNASHKLDSDAATQGLVMQKLGSLLTCLP